MSTTDQPNLVTRSGFSALEPSPFSEFKGPARSVVGAALKRAEESLAGPFHGVTIEGPVRGGLVPIASTGVLVQFESAESTPLHPSTRGEPPKPPP